jgi:1-acyl-sn-glycerol-3-phosphate acyltransferase
MAQLSPPTVSTFSRPYGATRAFVLIAPWLAYLLVADVALSMLLPLRLLAPARVYHASSTIAESVWAWIQAIFVRLNGADITVERRDFAPSRRSRAASSSVVQLPAGESAIVIANHVSWADFYLIQEVAQQAGMLGRCRWFAKRALRWVPFLGWGLWAMGMPLVSRKWASDQAELDRLFRGLVKDKLPVCRSSTYPVPIEA